MKRYLKNKKFRATLLFSLLMVLSIPIVMYSLLKTESTDVTTDAEEYVKNVCTLSFPFINPNSVQSGAVVSLDIVAYAPKDEVIKKIKIYTSEGTLFEEDYEDVSPFIAERTVFTSSTTGKLTLTGQLTTDVSTYSCVLSDSEDNTLSILTKNVAPVFVTDQTVAEPGNALKVGNSYRYELIATDLDGDDIQYSYSFTKGEDWLKMSVVEDGRNGTLKLLFEGVTDFPESYLANVFVHDGYNKHLRSQSWVISVDQAENDTPVVTIVEPSTEITVTKGEVIRLKWTATDLNQIVKYKLYYSTNPGKEERWVAINENVSYKLNTYDFDTSDVPSGQYKIIIQAEDNQNPSLTGSAISEFITINSKGGEDDGKPDDGVVIQEPQIVNINPADKSTINNQMQSITATLIAGTNANIIKESIVFKVDGIDQTKNIEESEISDSEFTVIYSPTEKYSIGEHKVEVSFEDDKDGKVSREWTFTVEEKDDDKDIIKIFGFEVSKRTFWIVVIGLGLILLFILVPWFIYLVWRNDDEDKTTNIYNLPPDSTAYSTAKQSSVIREKYYPSNTTTNAYTKFNSNVPPIKPNTQNSLAKTQTSTLTSLSQTSQDTKLKPVDYVEKKATGYTEVNTITGGIVRKPQFQTLTSKDETKTVVENQKTVQTSNLTQSPNQISTPQKFNSTTPQLNTDPLVGTSSQLTSTSQQSPSNQQPKQILKQTPTQTQPQVPSLIQPTNSTQTTSQTYTNSSKVSKDGSDVTSIQSLSQSLRKLSEDDKGVDKSALIKNNNLSQVPPKTTINEQSSTSSTSVKIVGSVPGGIQAKLPVNNPTSQLQQTADKTNLLPPKTPDENNTTWKPRLIIPPDDTK